MQLERWKAATRSSGTVWAGAGVHCIRVRNTTAQEAKATFEERGVVSKFITPKGTYFNPLELLFNDLKTHYIRPKLPKYGLPLPKSEIEELVQGYVDEKAPTTLRAFFRARANGVDAKKKQIL